MADPSTLNQSNTSTSNPNTIASTSTSSSIEKQQQEKNDGESNNSNSTLLNHYNTIKSHLPNSISTRLPEEEKANETINSITNKLTTLTTNSTGQLNELKKTATTKYEELRGNSSIMRNKVGDKIELSKESFLTNAWSVENGTQVILNVSLNQISPLFFEILPPNSVFERRVPNVYFNLSVRPYTTPSTATTTSSVVWPILALVGPVAAGVSILAIPFVAIAAGGTALASLTGFGAQVSSAAVGSASTVTKLGTTGVALVGRASKLPGGEKVKSKLVDAGKKLLLGTGGELVREKVVKYMSGSGISTGVAAGVIGTAAISTDIEIESEERKRAKVLEERKGKKFEEVEVTGFELVQVLKCSTGKKNVDQALINAFNRLSFKAKGFKTSDNPVLRITGGPELEERGSKQFLVFYPFVVEKATNIQVIPIPLTEVPPTKNEEDLIRDTRIVESTEEAETISIHAPQYFNGNTIQAKREVEEKIEGDGNVKAEEKGKKVGWWGF